MKIEMFRFVREFPLVLVLFVIGCSKQLTEKASEKFYIDSIECEEETLESWLHSSRFIGVIDGPLNYTEDKEKVCLAQSKLTVFRGELNPVCIRFNVLEQGIYANEIIAGLEKILLSDDRDKLISPLQYSTHSDAICALTLKEETSYIVIQKKNNSTLLAPVKAAERLKTKIADK